MGRRVLAAFATVALATFALGACGDDDEGGSGRTTLSWFVAQQPGGALDVLADRCTRASDGRYKIEIEPLPAQADAQREQLVRRLGAEDDSIDLIGMDVVWTGEFANARWIVPVPDDVRPAAERGVFESVLQTARFEDRLYGVPIWSNTQLLWYRDDRVPRAPRTWDEMIDRGEALGPDKGQIQVQANRYEGLVVWANWMLESAGTQVLAGPERIALRREPAERALAAMGRLSKSTVAAPDLTTSIESTADRGFQSGSSAFMINYPFVYASAKDGAPDVFEHLKAAKLPQIVPGRDSAPPIGGINLGVSAYSDHRDLAFDATRCLTSERNQLEVVAKEGLPPVRADLFDRSEVRKAYPGFAGLIKESISDAAPRPSESPAYQDLSLAIQRALHPTDEIDPRDPGSTYEDLRGKVQQAIDRDGLL